MVYFTLQTYQTSFGNGGGVGHRAISSSYCVLGMAPDSLSLLE